MDYFNEIANVGVYSRKRPLGVLDLNVMMEINPGSKWAEDELFAARVVIRTARSDRQFGHILPILRRHSTLVLAAREQPGIQALLKVPDLLDRHREMNEIQFGHCYGTSLGSFWDALAKFGDVEDTDVDVDINDGGDDDNRNAKGEDNGEDDGEDDREDDREENEEDDWEDNGEDDREDNGEDNEEDDGEDHGEDHDVDCGDGEYMDKRVGKPKKRSYSPSSDESATALPARSKRVRTVRIRQGFVDITQTKIESSSPQRSSQETCHGSDPTFVGKSHALTDVPEEATVEIASAFIRHVLQACPPQHDTLNHNPPYMVLFSRVSRQFTGKTAAKELIKATADGELQLHRLDNRNCYRPTGHRPALLEAKKRFAIIKDGQPFLTNELLGQMTCEALALCLQRTKETGQAEENIFIIAAVRRYMRFLQFTIPKSYINALTTQTEPEMLTDFVNVWATPWFDLEGPGGRRGAVDNIVALVSRQSHVEHA
ncbi:uncharacterized protein B0H64DRAFT_453110 [Chaetomium fimeti]|uniref:Uncharacterized protein n=1 Tax=Chaetomium fimeti TaxID=1854472 RepID=A0AAE0H722_9PEZI|nr:hypothetical protein B0H64DRAFT_453110 [Chaetomium fimeti]